MHSDSSGAALERPKHSPEFRRRRAQNWVVLGGTYASMYVGRYNFSYANQALCSTYGWSKTQIGWIITAGKLIYGLSAFLNGPLADRIGGRKAMIIGSAGAFTFNLLFGIGAYLGFLTSADVLLGYLMGIWALNSYFQSYSALSVVKVNSAWFHVSERGVFSAIFGVIIQSGRSLIYATGGILVALGWQWTFFVPAALIGLMCLATLATVKNDPVDAGLPALETADATSDHQGKVDLKFIVKVVFTNPITLTIAAAEFCTGFVRGGFEEWFPRYMTEVQHLPTSSALFRGGGLAIVMASLVAAFCAGFLSDWLFKTRRPPVAFIGYVIQVTSLVVIWRAPSLPFVIAAFMGNSFGVQMVHSMLSGTASMDFGGKKAAASAAGLFDGMQYLGASLVGSGLGFMLDRFGWGAWGPSMIGFSATGGILMLTLWNARPKAYVMPVAPIVSGVSPG